MGLGRLRFVAFEWDRERFGELQLGGLRRKLLRLVVAQVPTGELRPGGLERDRHWY